MRLLLEIIIVAALIYLGWNRPFKELAAQGSAMATSRIHAPAWEDHSTAPRPQQKEPHADRRPFLRSGRNAARLNQLSTIRHRLPTPRLLHHFFKLPTQERSVVKIKRDM